jgi:hypothetical protein
VPKKYLAEFLGSAILLMAIVGSGAMAQRLSTDVGIQLLINASSIVVALGIVIYLFGPISGAHFNPLVTMTQRARKELGTTTAIGYIAGQFLGGIVGTVIANLMFGRPAIILSTHVRTGVPVWLGEVIATAGLFFVIFLMVLRGGGKMIPVLVPAWIASAIFFTGSTAFANPMVTLSRSLTDTFTGIQASSVPMFIVAQIVGAFIGYEMAKYFAKGD